MGNIQRREADFGTVFRHYIKANPPRISCHFELKHTKKDSIPFSCLEEHQEEYALAIRDSNKGVLIRNMAGNGEPDYSYTYRDPVFLVIKFPAFFCIMSIDAFLAEKSMSKRKSLTGLRARAIAKATVNL